jgi:hypothetical protein
MALKGTSLLRAVRRPGALAALGMLALTLACGKDATSPPPPRDLNVAPVADFSATAGCTSAPVSLDASAAHDPDGTITLYEWDFESDGTIDASGPALIVVQHAYTPGTHRAKLVVTDNAAAYTVTVKSFTVAAPETMYVALSGSPLGPGTRQSPFSSLTSAIAAAASLACPATILVAEGRYVETPVLASGMTIRGGYDPVTWTHAAGAQSEVAGRSTTAVDVHNVEISDLRFWSGDLSEPSMSAVAVEIQNCDASLLFVRCAFVGGIPGNGLNGANGGGGVTGADGGNGSDGRGWGGGFQIGARNSASAGGQGGSANSGGEDGHGGCGTVGQGGAAGGGIGTAGSNGGPGVNGSGLATNGSFNGFAWVPAVGVAGTAGCDGSGGGGGGGGVNCGSTNGGIGHGGGGGEGGHAGVGGKGGHGGGASIALILIDASPRFEQCSWTTNQAGVAGIGGDGGPSGTGGAGGFGASSCSGPNGGDGGPGGTSGPGGGGQGGPGGPSWCIVKLGSSNPVLVTPTFNVGTGGAGGLGGLLGGSGPRAASGPDGPAAAFGP